MRGSAASTEGGGGEQGGRTIRHLPGRVLGGCGDGGRWAWEVRPLVAVTGTIGEGGKGQNDGATDAKANCDKLIWAQLKDGLPASKCKAIQRKLVHKHNGGCLHYGNTSEANIKEKAMISSSHA